MSENILNKNKNLKLFFVLFVFGIVSVSAYMVFSDKVSVLEKTNYQQSYNFLKNSCGSTNVISAFGGPKIGMANPSAIYCVELGYVYKNEKTNSGEKGICVFSHESSCDSWEFLEGICGAEYSYCAKNDYEQVVKSDGKNSLTPTYAVCVDGEQEVGSVVELSGVLEKAIKSSSKIITDAEITSSSDFLENYPTMSAPNSFTWRNKDGQDWITPVKNQGICGSCWAFSTVGVTEAMYNIKSNNPSLDLDLSEEYLVSDCHYSSNKDQTCCGGFDDVAFGFIKTYGVPDEACMPYVDGGSGGCSCEGDICSTLCTYSAGSSCSDKRCSDRCSDYASRLKKILGYEDVSTSATTIMQVIYDSGPVSVLIGISTDAGGYFDNGIYRCTDDDTINHAVSVVGYSYTGDPATSYWIVKNSWGISWPSSPNDFGFFKVGFSECGIQEWVLKVKLDICGNGVCELSENCGNCVQDCQSLCRCGDSWCNNGETCASCSSDCGSCCGDGSCNYGETCGSCYNDCKSSCRCGDGWCNNGENCASCSFDCGRCPYCGDGNCNNGETSCSCMVDCPGKCVLPKQSACEWVKIFGVMRLRCYVSPD